MATSHGSCSSASKDVEILVASTAETRPKPAKRPRKAKDASDAPPKAAEIGEIAHETAKNHAEPVADVKKEVDAEAAAESDPAPGAESKKKVMSSSIPELTVGDVRKCLNQIRRKGHAIQSQHLLQNGWTAGDFALKYLLGNSSTRKGGKPGAADEHDNNGSES